jgi:hypothetical protein
MFWNIEKISKIKMFLDWTKKKCQNKERNGEMKKIVEEEKLYLEK